MCFAPQRCALFRHLNFQKWSDIGVFCTFWLGNVLRATTACTFFDISTSKSGPTLLSIVHFDLEMCFAPQRRALFRQLNFQKWSDVGMLCTFDLEMCFAPQRRALFRQLNFQKWSDVGVFCTFWLGNVLRATTACILSTAQLPKVVRRWCVLYILTWKCASRHNVVHFFISHLASWLRTHRFSEVTFRLSGAPNHWKNTVNRGFTTFGAPASSFFWLSPFLVFSLLDFSSLTLPTSAFPFVHIVGSLTSKLPWSYHIISSHIFLILYYIILYYTILYYITLYFTILYYIILYHTLLYHIVLYCILSYHIKLDLLYCIILYYIKSYYTILYCIKISCIYIYMYIYIYNCIYTYICPSNTYIKNIINVSVCPTKICIYIYIQCTSKESSRTQDLLPWITSCLCTLIYAGHKSSPWYTWYWSSMQNFTAGKSDAVLQNHHCNHDSGNHAMNPLRPIYQTISHFFAARL